MSEHLLDDGLTQKKVVLIAASKGKRLANYLIDYFIVMFLLVFLFLAFDSMGWMSLTEGNPLVHNIFGYIGFVVYYFLMEQYANGKTIGKMITGTKVVDEKGNTPSPESIIGRSFARLVPFEAFSFLGDQPTGWHDRWSDTKVIDEAMSSLSVQPEELV